VGESCELRWIWRLARDVAEHVASSNQSKPTNQEAEDAEEGTAYLNGWIRMWEFQESGRFRVCLLPRRGRDSKIGDQLAPEHRIVSTLPTLPRLPFSSVTLPCSPTSSQPAR
jgi:hypothetical protein